jgi:hypothetical protein
LRWKHFSILDRHWAYQKTEGGWESSKHESSDGRDLDTESIRKKNRKERIEQLDPTH